MGEAYVTLATNDPYAVGAAVLAKSLKQVGTTKELCILITPGVTQPIRQLLSKVYDNVVLVDVLDSSDSAHLALMQRPELGITFTKLRCWTLTQYTKAVFLDADILAIQNADELFTEPELSACCDVGWPDCFNSGMFVFTPSMDTYANLLQKAVSEGSFDGGDQGLLNSFFSSWSRLSFVYNMVASATYSYIPAFRQFGDKVKFVHFLGAVKPWQRGGGGEEGIGLNHHLTKHLNAWWSTYARLVRPLVPLQTLPTTEARQSQPEYQPYVEVLSALDNLHIGEMTTAQAIARWESGQPDYMGLDAFDNIQKHLDKMVAED